MGRYMSKAEKKALKEDLAKRKEASRVRKIVATAKGVGNEPRQSRVPKKRPSVSLDEMKPGWGLPKDAPKGNKVLPSGRPLSDKEQAALDASNARGDKTRAREQRHTSFWNKVREQRRGRAADIAGGK